MRDMDFARQCALGSIVKDAAVASHEVDAEPERVEMSRLLAQYRCMCVHSRPLLVIDGPKESHGGITFEHVRIEILSGP